MEEEHLGAGFLGQGVYLGQGEGAKRFGAGRRLGEDVVAAAVVDGDGVVRPRHVRLETVEACQGWRRNREGR